VEESFLHVVTGEARSDNPSEAALRQLLKGCRSDVALQLWRPALPFSDGIDFPFGSGSGVSTSPPEHLDQLAQWLHSAGSALCVAADGTTIADVAVTRRKLEARCPATFTIHEYLEDAGSWAHVSLYAQRLAALHVRASRDVPVRNMIFRCEVACDAFMLHQIAATIRAGAAFSSFLLMSAFIDYLAQLWAHVQPERPSTSIATAYRDFITEFLVPLDARYDPSTMWRDVRNALLHGYAVRPQTHSLTDGEPNRHLTRFGTHTVLDAESWLRHLAHAKAELFKRIDRCEDLHPGFRTHINTVGILGYDPPYKSRDPF
jgi:hypothetical protein